MPTLRWPSTSHTSDPSMPTCVPLPHILRQYQAKAEGLPERKQSLITPSTLSRLCTMTSGGAPCFSSRAFAISPPVGESSVKRNDRSRS